jgi:hypothetical protein
MIENDTRTISEFHGFSGEKKTYLMMADAVNQGKEKRNPGGRDFEVFQSQASFHKRIFSMCRLYKIIKDKYR